MRVRSQLCVTRVANKIQIRKTILHSPESTDFVSPFMAFGISSIFGLSFSIAMGILFSILVRVASVCLCFYN
jgi:presenilin-like A22 family membrane protease